MGNWVGNSGSSSSSSSSSTSGVAPSFSAVNGEGYGLSKEYAADNAVAMPSMSDSALLAAAKLRRDLLARSGRTSTDLTGTYHNSFLGSV